MYAKLVECKDEQKRQANIENYKLARKKAKLVVITAKTVFFKRLYVGLKEKSGEKRLYRHAKSRE